VSKSVKIGPFDYEIVEIEGLRDESDGKKLDGWITHHNLTIKLEASLSPPIKRQTLWHEILHGILTKAGDREQNEWIMEALSFGIVEVLQDNPWLGES
jgi:hypothetical protein